MVELTPTPSTFSFLPTTSGIVFLGCLVLLVLILFLGNRKSRTDKGKISVEACIISLLPILVMTLVSMGWGLTNSRSHYAEENLSNIEKSYGVEFSTRTTESVIPAEGRFMVIENVRSMDSTTIWDQVMVENNDGFITLFVPESEGSTEFVELPLSD